MSFDNPYLKPVGHSVDSEPYGSWHVTAVIYLTVMVCNYFVVQILSF